MQTPGGHGLSRKAKLRQLDEQILKLESHFKAARPIPVLTIRECDHQSCGSAAPADYPEDCLIIVLGCEHEIPSFTPPPMPEIEHSSLNEIPEVLQDSAAPAGSPLERARKRMVQLNLSR